MNKMVIIGNLTRDPETGATEGGINWCRFSVAVNRRTKREGQPEADYIQVTAWRGLGDTCAKYLHKGKKVCVIGEARASAWTGRDGSAKGQIELTAQDVEFLSPGEGRRDPTDADAPGGGPADAQAVDAQSGMTTVDPDDLPY
jgi:single-strand DNA-binding protein